MKLLVCGGYGFIGSAFIKNHLNNFSNDEIINIDNLTIGSNKFNLSEINNNNYSFVKEDIKLPKPSTFRMGIPDMFMSSPTPFVISNLS